MVSFPPVTVKVRTADSFNPKTVLSVFKAIEVGATLLEEETLEASLELTSSLEEVESSTEETKEESSKVEEEE